MSEPAPGYAAQRGLYVPGVTHMGRFEWERVIRRCRLGFYEGKAKDPKRWVPHSTVQGVALVMATWADLDGTSIRPSVALLALVCETDERKVRACITHLRHLMLLELVKAHRSPGRGGGPGRPAEYRMAAPDDLLSRVAHFDPEFKTLIVPDGVDTPPPRKPRSKKADGDAVLWPVPDA